MLSRIPENFQRAKSCGQKAWHKNPTSGLSGPRCRNCRLCTGQTDRGNPTVLPSYIITATPPKCVHNLVLSQSSAHIPLLLLIKIPRIDILKNTPSILCRTMFINKAKSLKTSHLLNSPSLRSLPSRHPLRPPRMSSARNPCPTEELVRSWSKCSLLGPYLVGVATRAFFLRTVTIVWKEIYKLPVTSRYYGKGNGTPLQSSCLENPRNRGAWWAAVHGVTQSRTRLKWLSSSSRYHRPMAPFLFPGICSHQRTSWKFLLRGYFRLFGLWLQTRL